jgi:hypothetical protein
LTAQEREVLFGEAAGGSKTYSLIADPLRYFGNPNFNGLLLRRNRIPSYSHGVGGVMGVGRIASGMSMLMGAAAQNIKAVIRNIDDYLLSPIGKALFAFNMQFNFDEEFVKGDLDVRARGTESLMRNEIRSERLLQFIQMAQNPQMAPFVKYDYILREIAASMDLDEDKILNDPREAVIQAKMMAEIQAMMPQPPAGTEQPQSGAPSVRHLT